MRSNFVTFTSAVSLSLVLLLSACGDSSITAGTSEPDDPTTDETKSTSTDKSATTTTDESTTTSTDDQTTTSTDESTMTTAEADDEITASTDGPSDASDEWVRTGDGLRNFVASSDGEVSVDVSNPAQLIVSFDAGFAPCAGGRAKAVETQDTITVFLELGQHKDVAAMTCPAGLDNHEILLPLQDVAGDRTITLAGASVSTPAPNDYLGLSFDDAKALADRNNIVWRLARQDDESFMLTEDYSPDRINFEVDVGVVTAVNAG